MHTLLGSIITWQFFSAICLRNLCKLWGTKPSLFKTKTIVLLSEILLLQNEKLHNLADATVNIFNWFRCWTYIHFIPFNAQKQKGLIVISHGMNIYFFIILVCLLCDGNTTSSWPILLPRTLPTQIAPLFWVLFTLNSSDNWVFLKWRHATRVCVWLVCTTDVYYSCSDCICNTKF